MAARITAKIETVEQWASESPAWLFALVVFVVMPALAAAAVWGILAVAA